MPFPWVATALIPFVSSPCPHNVTKSLLPFLSRFPRSGGLIKQMTVVIGQKEDLNVSNGSWGVAKYNPLWVGG